MGQLSFIAGELQRYGAVHTLGEREREREREEGGLEIYLGGKIFKKGTGMRIGI